MAPLGIAICAHTPLLTAERHGAGATRCNAPNRICAAVFSADRPRPAKVCPGFVCHDRPDAVRKKPSGRLNSVAATDAERKRCRPRTRLLENEIRLTQGFTEATSGLTMRGRSGISRTTR